MRNLPRIFPVALIGAATLFMVTAVSSGVSQGAETASIPLISASNDSRGPTALGERPPPPQNSETAPSGEVAPRPPGVQSEPPTLEPLPQEGPPAAGAVIQPEATGDEDFKPEAPRPVPENPDERESMIAELKLSPDKGLLVPDIPAEMMAFEKLLVTVRLARGNAAAKILAKPTIDLRDAGEIPTSDFVNVRLDGGDAFDVVSVLPDMPQDLHAHYTGEWEFWVTPKLGGTHDLNVIVLLFDNPAYSPVAKFTRSISVVVSLTTQILTALEGSKEFIVLFVAGLLSILAAGWYERRTRLARPKGPGPDGSG